MNCENLVSWKNKKNIFNLLFVELAQRVGKENTVILSFAYCFIYVFIMSPLNSFSYGLSFSLSHSRVCCVI